MSNAAGIGVDAHNAFPATWSGDDSRRVPELSASQ